MKKYLGYIISGIGIIILLLSFSNIQTAVGLDLGLSENTLIIISIVIILVGLFFLKKNSKKKNKKEVPIYDEDEVVGFRRLKKK